MTSSRHNNDGTDAETPDLKFTVSLPPTVHETPDDEAALAIDNVALMPNSLMSSSQATSTIILTPQSALTHPQEHDRAPLIPALPESDDVYARRVPFRGEVSARPESAAALTDARLLDSTRRRRREPPEGFLQKLLFDATLGFVNIGDSYAVQRRKALDARVSRQLAGDTRFIAVLTRKGGVGKTTISALLGMALADVREDRVIAIDGNPDRGTLAERVTKTTRATVRDVVSRAGEITTFNEFQTLVSRDETRLDIIASDSEPTVSEALGDNDYNVIASLAERFYSLAITDCGTGVVHSVMKATLLRADSIVVVSGGSVDEARLASETLTWLESNGYAELAANAVVALNTATQGTNLVKIEEIESHFRSRVREIVRIPYDPTLATGSVIHYRELKELTRDAARELAALVVDGLPEQRVS